MALHSRATGDLEKQAYLVKATRETCENTKGGPLSSPETGRIALREPKKSQKKTPTTQLH